MFEYRLTVRGYELDSYNHVNNAVYLNYLEQARWEILLKENLIDIFRKEELLLVVTEINIRYSQEARVFDELLIITRMLLEGPYIIFKHRIINAQTNEKLVVSTIKSLVINKERIPCSIPDEFHSLFEK